MEAYRSRHFLELETKSVQLKQLLNESFDMTHQSSSICLSGGNALSLSVCWRLAQLDVGKGDLWGINNWSLNGWRGKVTYDQCPGKI